MPCPRHPAQLVSALHCPICFPRNQSHNYSFAQKFVPFKAASARSRLRVAGQPHGWAVSRPGEQVRPETVNRVSAGLELAIVHIRRLLLEIPGWSAVNPVIPQNRRDLLYLYFKLWPPPLNAAPTAANFARIQAKFQQILNGLNDTEVSFVDNKAAEKGVSLGYVRGTVPEGGGQPGGRIHLDFGDGEDGHPVLAGAKKAAMLIVHEASHKFAETADVMYLPSVGALLRLFVPGRNKPLFGTIPYRGLTAAQAMNNADSYGGFLAEYSQLNP